MALGEGVAVDKTVIKGVFSFGNMLLETTNHVLKQMSLNNALLSNLMVI